MGLICYTECMSQDSESFPMSEGAHSPKSTDPLEAYTTPDGLFTPEHTGQLFFNSFRFSQGNSDLQLKLFSYLAERYGLRFSPELVEEGVAMVAPRIQKFATKGTMHSQREDRSVKLTIDQEKSNLLSALESLSMSPATFNPLETLEEILYRDAKYVIGRGRDRNRVETGDNSRSHGVHVSHFVYYGLLGNDTGCPEYNALFAELVDNLANVPDTIIGADPAAMDIETPVISVLEGHFKAYPADVSRITPAGLAALETRFQPPELKQLGLTVPQLQA